jgi:CBS domain-containing protein
VHPAECVLAHDVHPVARYVKSFTQAVSSVDFQLSLESEGVGSAYPDQPLAATADETVGTVMQLLRAQRTGAVLICEGPKLVGIFTERDALKQMASGADLSAPVRTVMTSDPATVASDATVGNVIRMMSEGSYRHLPIVDQDRQPKGVLAVHGIVHYLVDHFPETVYNLPPDPKAAPKAREGA